MGSIKKSNNPKPSKRRGHFKIRRDFEELVGSNVYDTWLKMLKDLVPWGRTHRLAVVVAGMLQYAASCRNRSKAKDNSIVQLLDESDEIGMDYDEQQRLILPLIEQLFKDAGVKWKRTNSRGEGYSIAENSMGEFLQWDLMPWE